MLATSVRRSVLATRCSLNCVDCRSLERILYRPRVGEEGSDGNNQLVSYDYVVLYRNITNLIIIAPGDYIM